MAKDDIGGVWRTISGRRVFIKDGQDLASAMRESGKFKNIGKNPKVDRKKNKYATNNEGGIDDNTSKFADEAIKHWEKENQKYKEKYGKDDEMALKFKSQWEKEKSNRLYGEKSAKMNETMDRRQVNKVAEAFDPSKTYWNGEGKYQDFVNSLENKTDKELMDAGIPKTLINEYREEARKYYRWFNDGDKPHQKTLEGKDYASARYLSQINSKEERDYWNNLYAKDMETRVNTILEKMQEKYNPKNEASEYYSKLSKEEIKKDLDERKNRLNNNYYDEKDKKMYEDFYNQGEEYYKSKYLEERNREVRYEKALGEYTGGKDYGEKIKKTGNDFLPKAKKVETAGTSNRKEVSDNIQAHILEYYDNPVDFMEQMDAMDWLPTRWHAGQKLAEGGSYLIYNGDMADFLNSLNINPKGKKFSEDKSFQMYTSLIGRESERLYNRLEKLFDQYKKEHKNSNATLEDFRKWFK